MIDTFKCQQDWEKRNQPYPDIRKIDKKEYDMIRNGELPWWEIDECECNELNDVIDGLRTKIKERK